MIKFIIIFIYPFAVYPNFEKFSEILIQTREDIEVLNLEVENLKKINGSQLDALLTQRSELESLLSKERLRRLQLKQKRKALKQGIAPYQGLSSNDKAQLMGWYRGFELWIKNSIPFKIEQRLANLVQINRAIQQGSSYHEIINRFWKLAQSELSLVNSNEYEIIKLVHGGKKITAEVARVGSLIMAFKIPDGRYGFIIKNKDKWELSFNDPSSSQILISKFKEKKFTGLFELPIANL